jgi:phosphomannomutase
MNEKLLKVFKAYDLRANSADLSPEIYYLTGKGLIEKILKPENLPLKVVLGKDARLTSDLFYKALIKGIIDAGGEVVSFGLCSTEIVYAGAILNNCSGAMVTASHNPKDDNGLKIVKKIPQMLGLNSGLGIIRDYTVENIENVKINWSEVNEPDQNTIFLNQALEFWKENIIKIGDLDAINNKEKRLKVVVDTGNGMGGFIMPLIENLYQNIDFIPLFWEIDGEFPNHPADPIHDENLQDLKKKVLEVNADFGVAFDGDADRAFIVDEKGESLNNELLCGLFSKFMGQYIKANSQLDFNPAIIYTMSYSRCAANAILETGCGAIPSIQGHTFIKQKMHQFKAIYGSEASGHHYFGEFGFMDSGALTMALFIKIYSNLEKKASELLNEFKETYFLSGEKNFKLNPNYTIEIIREKIQNEFPNLNYWTEDGITVFARNWKVSIRTSNTEPLARINVETLYEDKTSDILNRVKKVLELN